LTWAGGATRPLPRDGGVEELHGDPTVGHAQGLDHRSKMEEVVSAEDGAPERLGCETVKKEVSQIL